MKVSTQIGRLAMRVEGNFWKAYYAQTHTMDGAVFLGSIAMRGVTRKPGRKEAFLAIMRELVGDILEDETGVRPTWPNPPVEAPEHERGA